jgi:hypothetical protein
MTDMSTLPVDRLAQLLADYSTTPNQTLADRYDLTLGAVERIGRTNQLRKNAEHCQERLRAAVAARADGNQPAPDRPAWPTITGGPYCKRCGQTNYHWSGCPASGTDHRPDLPAAS